MKKANNVAVLSSLLLLLSAVAYAHERFIWRPEAPPGSEVLHPGPLSEVVLRRQSQYLAYWHKRRRCSERVP